MKGHYEHGAFCFLWYLVLERLCITKGTAKTVSMSFGDDIRLALGESAYTTIV
jgi:hypothetical protein